MELDLQSLFGLNVHSCTHWLRTRNPSPPHLGSYTRALLVRQSGLTQNSASARPSQSQPMPVLWYCAGILEQPIPASMHGSYRNRVEIGFSYRPARICKRFRNPGIDSEESIPVRQIGFSYRPARHEIDSWAPLQVHKYGLKLDRLVESIPWNRFLGFLKVQKYRLCFLLSVCLCINLISIVHQVLTGFNFYF